MNASKILSFALIALFVVQANCGIKDFYNEKIKPYNPVIKVALGASLVGLAWYSNNHAHEMVAGEGSKDFAVNCATASLPLMKAALDYKLAAVSLATAGGMLAINNTKGAYMVTKGVVNRYRSTPRD